MKLLLDTHILLWALSDDPKLSKRLRDALLDPEAMLYVSAVVLWEISIKRGLGKLVCPDGMIDIIRASGARPLPISWDHADQAGRLPSHHADPFDRLLIAQSQCENIPIVSKDRAFSRYEVTIF